MEGKATSTHTAAPGRTQTEGVKSSFAEAEQNFLLIYTLQEAKPKKPSEHLGLFVVVFNSAESHIKNKSRGVRGRQSWQGQAQSAAGLSHLCGSIAGSSTKTCEGEESKEEAKGAAVPHKALAPPVHKS